MLTSSEALGFEQIEVQGSSNFGDQHSTVSEVGYLEEFRVLKVDSAISLAWVDFDLVVGIFSILFCFAERDGWGESSFVFTGCDSRNPFDSLFALSRGCAATSFRMPGFRHSNTLVD